jgi:hypothetical protein
VKKIALFLSLMAFPVNAADFSGAKYVKVTHEEARAMVGILEAKGYRCGKVDMVSECLTDRCFRISCDLQWVYYLYQSNRGGFDIKTE